MAVVSGDTFGGLKVCCWYYITLHMLVLHCVLRPFRWAFKSKMCNFIEYCLQNSYNVYSAIHNIVLDRVCAILLIYFSKISNIDFCIPGLFTDVYKVDDLLFPKSCKDLTAGRIFD